MASEWTGCDTGTCVQYRTVDGKVFVRNSTDEERILEFTVAEWWGTFVAGLVAEVSTDRDNWVKICAQMDEKNATLAAGNARLRQQLATAEGQLLDSWARLSSVEDERDRLTAALDRTVLERDTTHRRYLEAVAEAEVLRHRDRRTQAVVEAADNLLWLKDGPRDDIYRSTKPKAWNVLREALATLQEGPSAPLSATESAEQAQVVPESTPGPETQGEAQRAIRRGWPRCPDCGATFDGEGLDEHRELGTCPKHADGILAPRVWNVGDPEPEGVEKVVDREDSPWQRAADGTWWCGPYAVVPLGGNSWEHALKWAPLTEVLPEPVPKIHVCRQGLDAAIEAARNASCEHIYELDLPSPCLECRIRAASPLIERAALLAAADEIQDAYEDMDYTDSRADGIEFVLLLLRDRATRKETS